MILDRLENAALYFGLGGRIALALKSLSGTDLPRRPVGRYDLAGDDVFALVQHYDTKPRELGKWEAHRKYLDVQYVEAGVETMGYAPLGRMTITDPYDEEKDFLLFDGRGDFVTVAAGSFAVFFPHDVHMPALAVGSPAAVKKVVVKVRVG